MEKAAMKNSKASSSTASGIPTFSYVPPSSYPAAIALMKNQRKYRKKTREEVLKGKNIRVDKNGFENFDDYFTDSDADKTKANASKNVCDVKNSKKDHLEQKLHSGTKITTSENDIPFNNNSPQNLTNGVEKRANESKSAQAMKKLKPLPVPLANGNNIVLVDLTSSPDASPPSTRKNSRNGSSGFSPSKDKLEEHSSEILTRKKNRACTNLSTPPDSVVSKSSSKSKSPEKLAPVSPNKEKETCNVTLERALSPCKIYLNDVCKVKDFVEREENCIINFDTGKSPVKDKPHLSSPKIVQKLKTKIAVEEEEYEPLVEGLDVVELKNHKVSPGKSHPTPKSNYLDPIFDLNEQVKMLENCKNLRLEIDPLPETISIIANSLEPSINQKSEEKLGEYRKTNKAPQPDAQTSPKRRIAENVQVVLNDIRTNPSENDLENQLLVPNNEKLVKSCYDKQKDLSDEKRKSVRNNTGGKHFLPKRTVSTRQRRSILREKSDGTDSDTDETSESDGHIYLPSKPSKPKPMKNNGNNEDLAVPSTSGWKPPKKKGRKAKSESKVPQVSEKPKKPKNLSPIMEVEENQKLQPVVRLQRIDFTKPNVPEASPQQRNQNKNVSETNVRESKLVSALKGNKLKSKRLSVSFKEDPINFDSPVQKKEYPHNFLPLNTPEINTPNARRSKRKKIPRLNLGLNQRIVYQKKGNDLTAVAVDLGSEIPRRKPRTTVKKDPDRSLSIHLTLNEGNMAAINAPPMVLDLENDNETEYDLYTKKDSITWFGPSAEEAKSNDPYVIAKMVNQNKFSAGYLKLRGGCEKPCHELWDNTLVFVVIKGKILVEIHNCQLIMESQETFTVPKGNSYHLKNLRRDEAQLWFTSYKD